MTFSIDRQTDRGFQLAECHISWSELSQELEQVRIVPPPLSWLPQFGFTHAQRLRLHLQIAFRVDIRRVDGDVPQPCSDRVDVDPCPQQVGGRGVPNRVRPDSVYVATRRDSLCAILA